MIPQPLAYTRLVGSLARTFALLIAVATGFAPTVLEYCATTCEAHGADTAPETARASTMPPCHRAATAVTTTTRVDQAPDGCGHDHHPSMATLTAERPTADRHAPIAAMPLAHDAFGPSVRIATATPSGPPGDVLQFAQRAVPLRI